MVTSIAARKISSTVTWFPKASYAFRTQCSLHHRLLWLRYSEALTDISFSDLISRRVLGEAVPPKLGISDYQIPDALAISTLACVCRWNSGRFLPPIRQTPLFGITIPYQSHCDMQIKGMVWVSMPVALFQRYMRAMR